MTKLKLIQNVSPDKILDPIDRRLREEFGVSADALRGCVREAHQAKIAASPFAPKTSAGQRFYEQIVVALRVLFLGLPGWKMTSERNQEFVQNVDRGLRVGYVKTDAGTAQFDPDTGLLLRMSSTRPRGKAGRQTVASNQLMLFRESSVRAAPSVGGIRTWLVAVHATAGGYRVELALPLLCEKSGHIIEWKDRIAIGEVTLDSEPKLPEDAAPQPTAKPRATRKKP